MMTKYIMSRESSQFIRIRKFYIIREINYKSHVYGKRKFVPRHQVSFNLCFTCSLLLPQN